MPRRKQTGTSINLDPTEDSRSEDNSSSSEQQPDPFGPELFLGIVAPIGIPGDTLADALRIVMERVNYGFKTIKISDLFYRISTRRGAKEDIFRKLHTRLSKEEEYYAKIAAGDRFCELLGNDSLVALGIQRTQELRSELAAKHPDRMIEEHQTINRQAYYFHSLKRPVEIDRLRRIYGESFLLISAHAPHDYRIDRLSRKFASSELQFDPDLSRWPAEKLLSSDESENKPYGQNVRQAYHKADFFISVAGTRQAISEELWRFISILFGAHFHTPKPDEQGMALAYLAALRSAHPQRQVGAAITTQDGSMVAIGCNDVPRSFGGLYWPDDKDDRRDFQLKEYESLAIRQEVLADILKRLDDAGFLNSKIKKELERDQEKFFEDMNSGKYRELRDSRLMDALEFDRTVHAEMAAITDAARRGVSLSGCTLYSTTFPCHNCARHIVAAGIKRVVYTQPFVKSLTKRLHGDAICVDAAPDMDGGKVRFDPFLGISPSLYATLFTIRKRMGQGDRWKRFAKWDQRESIPLFTREPYLYTPSERRATEWLAGKLRQHNLTYKGGGV